MDEKSWTGIVAEANRLRGLLDKKPDALKCGYYCSPGSILNAYREGDVNFTEAVEQLEKWRGRGASNG